MRLFASYGVRSRRAIGVVLIAGVLAALCVVPVSATPGPVGPVTGLRSVTHADPTAWYNSSTATFVWDRSVETSGYSYSLDRNDTDSALDAVVDPAGAAFISAASTKGFTLDLKGPAVADFDGDGNLDTAVTTNRNRIEVFHGKGDGTFEASTRYTFASTSEKTHRCITADFNGDSLPDIAVTQETPVVGFFYVLLNNGDGGFGAPIQSPAANGWYLSGIASADFDGDGKTDVVAGTRFSEGAVWIYRGNGDGTFQAPVKHVVDAVAGGYGEVGEIATGDIDHNGSPDIAIVATGGKVGIIYNDGAGGFNGPETVLTIDSVIHRVQIADMDGDGWNDVVTANYSWTETFSLLRNKQDGTFARSALGGSNAQPIFDGVVVDVNRDGLPDLVGKAYWSLQVVMNQGGGVFSDAQQHDCSYGDGNHLAAGDFNGDGSEDIVTTVGDYDVWEANRVEVELNTPSKTYTGLDEGTWYFHVKGVAGADFGTTANTPVHIDTKSPTIEISGVVNGGEYLVGSGAQITLTATDPNMPDASGLSALSYHDDTWTFSGETPEGESSLVFDLPSYPGVFTYEVRAVDNISNATDMTFSVTMVGDVASLSSSTHPEPGTRYIDPNPGFKWGTFATGKYSYSIDRDPEGEPDLIAEPWFPSDPMLYQGTYAGGVTISDVATGDLNEDGFDDYVVGLDDDSGVIIQLNNGDGTFETDDPSDYISMWNPDTYNSVYPQVVKIADMNGDGHLDIVTADGWDCTIGVIFGNGDGTFGTITYSPVSSDGGVYAIDVADFDGDGRLDVLAAGSDNEYYYIALNTTDAGDDAASFEWHEYYMGNDFWSVSSSWLGDFVRAADIDGDSIPDVVIGDYSSGFFTAINQFDPASDFYEFSDQGTWTFDGSGDNVRSLEVADLDGDGNLDVVAVTDDNSFEIFYGSGGGWFETGEIYDASGAQMVRIADVNGDDSLEILVQCDANSGVRIFVRNGSGSYNEDATVYSPDSDFVCIGVGDFNDDGNADAALGTRGYDVDVFFGSPAAYNVKLGPLDPGIWYFHVRQVGAEGEGAIGGSTSTFMVDIAKVVKLTYLADDNGTLEGTTCQELVEGSDASAVTAVANAGYHFLNWTGPDAFESTANPLVIASASEDATYTAHFETNEKVRISAAYPGFSSDNFAGFQINGDAQIIDGVFRLTEAIEEQSGSFFTKQLVNISKDGFSSFFTLDIYDAGWAPADGMCFVVQPSTSSAVTEGGGLGYAGITPSVAIEFDTFWNSDPDEEIDDPDGNHVGLNVNGSVKSIQTATPPGDLHGNTWNVWIEYNPGTSLLEVRMSTTLARPATPTLSATIDVADIIGDSAYVGMTAATGGAYEAHDITGFYFDNSYLEGGLDPAVYDYLCGPASVMGSLENTATPSGGSTMVDIHLTGSDGKPLAGWPVYFSCDDGSSGTFGTTTVITDAEGRAQTTFAPDDATAYTLCAEADGGLLYTLTGSVTHALSYGAGTGGSLEGDTQQVVTHGSDATTVRAVPATGYRFVKWSDGVTTASRTDSEVTKNLDVTAEFGVLAYTITPGAGAHGAISPATAQSVDWDGSKAFTVTADEGYHIASLTVNGTAVAPAAGQDAYTYTFEHVKADATISATFAIDTFTVTLDSRGGSNVAAQTVEYGANVAKVAAPTRSGYDFGGWYTSATDFADANRFDFSGTAVTEDLTLYARWAAVGTSSALTGSRVTFTPAIPGGLFTYDPAYFKVISAVTQPTVPQGMTPQATATASDLVTIRIWGPVVLEPIKVGISPLYYVAPTGETQTLQVTVSTVVTADPTSTDSGLPGTGANLAYLLLAALGFAVGGLALRRRDRKQAR